jgi:RHS repeat-associated protein
LGGTGCARHSDVAGRPGSRSEGAANPGEGTMNANMPMTEIPDYRARYYDPTVGRFISEDPAAFDLQWPNLYSYVKNGPTDLIDPLGLSPQVLGPFVCTWCGEFGGGAVVMWDYYQRMTQLKWKRSDKWFHCMANCRATNIGSGGAAAAKVISFFRSDVRSRWTEPTDWQNDRVANYCGQQGGNCEQTCAPFAPPPSSPGKPPFPGFPNH